MAKGLLGAFQAFFYALPFDLKSSPHAFDGIPHLDTIDLKSSI
jgi:hypothetical protein